RTAASAAQPWRAIIAATRAPAVAAEWAPRPSQATREKRMIQRFQRSWALAKASFSILRQDKELRLFPLFSAASLLVLVACFAAPIIGLGALDRMPSDPAALNALHYGIAFLFYFCQYLVIFFFNSALVGAALERLDGGDPT